MSFLIAALVGALIGWIASLVMHTDAQQGPLANIIIGIVGAALGKWVFGDLLGFGGAQSAGAFTLQGLLWGVVGAVVLIAVLKFFRVMGSGSNV